MRLALVQHTAADVSKKTCGTNLIYSGTARGTTQILLLDSLRKTRLHIGERIVLESLAKVLNQSKTTLHEKCFKNNKFKKEL